MTELAVLTGDIVKSRALPPGDLDKVFAALSNTAKRIEAWQNAPVHLSRFRGDGWQMVLRPTLLFRSLMMLRAAVRSGGKGFDTRVGVGIGQGHVLGPDLAEANGEAFVASGSALDTMPRRVYFSAPEGPRALRTALPLADQIIAGWTARQAEIVLALLDPDQPTQMAVAQRLGLAQQTVQKQAFAAGLAALLEVCGIFETE